MEATSKMVREKRIEKYTKPSPICPECSGWLEEKDGIIRCRSCQYRRKATKRIVYKRTTTI